MGIYLFCHNKGIDFGYSIVPYLNDVGGINLSNEAFEQNHQYLVPTVWFFYWLWPEGCVGWLAYTSLHNDQYQWHNLQKVLVRYMKVVVQNQTRFPAIDHRDVHRIVRSATNYAVYLRDVLPLMTFDLIDCQVSVCKNIYRWLNVSVDCFMEAALRWFIISE